MAKRSLRYGEPISHLHLKSNRNPRFAMSSVGGRYFLLCVITELARPEARAALRAVEQSDTVEGERVIAVLCSEPAAETDPHIARIAQQRLVFYDGAEAIAEWGLRAPNEERPDKFVLFDPTLRALAFWPLEEADKALRTLASTPPPDAHAGVPLHAPVLIVPRIFEPEFCRELIDAYERAGGKPSGTTRENEAGMTYVGLDDGFKKRSDYEIAEKHLRDGAMHRMFWRLNPEIDKAFMQRMTRMERYIVACYDAQSGGYFRAHRDNTTKGTAHRKFAVTINLNAEQYDGGDLRFPEFGSRTYRAPTGGAVVFGCALLHEATPVTRGKRYAFLPFLYDEAGARMRAANNKYLDQSIGPYEG
ncbi:MAG TPA: 2OG-Fe(II) oxygenase [Caulobacterales bacterium]|nr:2OG-Fe(II) oxygenase [Caulobacterales bacterium]